MNESVPPQLKRAGELIAEKYLLVRRLGKGGMGTVWEAHHTKVERRFAIKFLLPELSSHEETRLRFEREAKTAGAIASEHVAAVFDYGVTEAGEPFIVMELLEGEDLARLLAREGQLAVVRATELICQASRGLQKAHERGVVHRDLKPTNLFVSKREDGTELCKVLDFGVAKLATPSSGISTKTGQMIGTLDYMSPEQLRGDAGLDARADVYSLGCVLYECLAGRRPYVAEEAHVLMYRIFEAQIAPLEELRPNLPAGLAEVVHRALAPDTERRFQNMAELRQALATFTAKAPAPSSPMISPTTLPTPQTGPVLYAVPALVSRGPSARARRTPLAVALGVATVGFAIWLGARGTKEDAAPITQSAVAASTTPNLPPSLPAPALAPPAKVVPTASASASVSAPSATRAKAPMATSSARRVPTVTRAPTAPARPTGQAGGRASKFDLDAKPYD